MRQIDKIHGTAKLLETVRENESELPGVAPLLASLEKSHASAVSSHDRREKLVVASQEATKQLNEDLADIGEAGIAIRSYIKGVLGYRNPKLACYGIKPSRKRSRLKKPLAGTGLPS